MSVILRSIGVFGVLLFGLLFSLTFTSPEAVEKSAKGFEKYQIEKEVRAQQQAVSQSAVAEKASGIAERLGFERETILASLDNRLPEEIAGIIMGFGYLAYLAAIFGVLLDIAFNKARVTTEIINGIANAIGSAFSVVPC